MKDRDRFILNKILKYCEEIKQTHVYFNNDKDLFFDEDKGYVYRKTSQIMAICYVWLVFLYIFIDI